MSLYLNKYVVLRDPRKQRKILLFRLNATVGQQKYSQEMPLLVLSYRQALWFFDNSGLKVRPVCCSQLQGMASLGASQFDDGSSEKGGLSWVNNPIVQNEWTMNYGLCGILPGVGKPINSQDRLGFFCWWVTSDAPFSESSNILAAGRWWAVCGRSANWLTLIISKDRGQFGKDLVNQREF